MNPTPTPAWSTACLLRYHILIYGINDFQERTNDYITYISREVRKKKKKQRHSIVFLVDLSFRKVASLDTRWKQVTFWCIQNKSWYPGQYIHRERYTCKLDSNFIIGFSIIDYDLQTTIQNICSLKKKKTLSMACFQSNLHHESSNIICKLKLSSILYLQTLSQQKSRENAQPT